MLEAFRLFKGSNSICHPSDFVLLFHKVQLQSPKSPQQLSPEDGLSAAVESYNPRGSASFVEQRPPAKECKFELLLNLDSVCR